MEFLGTQAVLKPCGPRVLTGHVTLQTQVLGLFPVCSCTPKGCGLVPAKSKFGDLLCLLVGVEPRLWMEAELSLTS